MSALIIGVDLAATQFELALANDGFELQERRRLDRAQFAQFCRELSPSLILMEACGSAHYWARALRRSGHQVCLTATGARQNNRPTMCAAVTSPAGTVQTDAKCPVKLPARGSSGVGCPDSHGPSKEPFSASRRNGFSSHRMAGRSGQDVCACVGGDRRTPKGNDRGGKSIALSDAPRPSRA